MSEDEQSQESQSDEKTLECITFIAPYPFQHLVVE